MIKLPFWTRKARAACRVVAAIVTLFAITGCSIAKMAVMPALAEASEALPVDRPAFSSSFGTQTWSFGVYTAKNVDLGWTRGASGAAGEFTASVEAQRFSFELVDASAKSWKAACEIVAQEVQRMGLVSGFSESRGTTELTCSFADPGSVEMATLKADVANEGAEAQSVGSMKVGEEEISLVLTKRQEGSSLGSFWATGIIFEKGDATLGAVDVMNQGIVYLGKGVDESTRFSVAAASVALLIFGTALASS